VDPLSNNLTSPLKSPFPSTNHTTIVNAKPSILPLPVLIHDDSKTIEMRIDCLFKTLDCMKMDYIRQITPLPIKVILTYSPILNLSVGRKGFTKYDLHGEEFLCIYSPCNLNYGFYPANLSSLKINKLNFHKNLSYSSFSILIPFKNLQVNHKMRNVKAKSENQKSNTIIKELDEEICYNLLSEAKYKTIPDKFNILHEKCQLFNMSITNKEITVLNKRYIFSNDNKNYGRIILFEFLKLIDNMNLLIIKRLWDSLIKIIANKWNEYRNCATNLTFYAKQSLDILFKRCINFKKPSLEIKSQFLTLFRIKLGLKEGLPCKIISIINSKPKYLTVGFHTIKNKLMSKNINGLSALIQNLRKGLHEIFLCNVMTNHEMSYFFNHNLNTIIPLLGM